MIKQSGYEEQLILQRMIIDKKRKKIEKDKNEKNCKEILVK